MNERNELDKKEKSIKMCYSCWTIDYYSSNVVSALSTKSTF